MTPPPLHLAVRSMRHTWRVLFMCDVTVDGIGARAETDSGASKKALRDLRTIAGVAAPAAGAVRSPSLWSGWNRAHLPPYRGFAKCSGTIRLQDLSGGVFPSSPGNLTSICSRWKGGITGCKTRLVNASLTLPKTCERREFQQLVATIALY